MLFLYRWLNFNFNSIQFNSIHLNDHMYKKIHVEEMHCGKYPIYSHRLTYATPEMYLYQLYLTNLKKKLIIHL